ncbi:hypothetical protein QYF61_016461 [Mycteria americana]|uniref:Uncharacterized protein n=1 Tax=Mycteria americana TaxID=33587 RepID=A0AAN7N6W8_MYCAM|nr:hypothetical protein QYF61_003441 [Mycteria americana]KAK4805611.1 hypothetical protein QYF61_016461 [Mycteria americana]
MSSQFLQENAVGNMRHHKEHIFYISYHHLGMRGFTAGGTNEYRTAITRSWDGEEMEGGFRGDPQHSPEDLHIGQHNENKTSQNKKSTNHKKPNLAEVGV